MAFIQDISVDIVRGTKALARAGFGLPLIIGDGTPDATGTSHAVETYKEYDSMNAVEEDYTSATNEHKMASAMFAQSPNPRIISIYSKGTKTITEALGDVNGTDPGFYAIFIAERTAAGMTEAGDWANSNQKFFFGCAPLTEDPLDGRNADREAYLVHDADTDYPECAWAGQNLPKDPGSITWKWKSLNLQVASGYSITDLNTIRGDNGQAITEIGGVPIVNEGITTSGEYIDVIRGQDWVKARIEEDLYQLFISNDKVAMDNVGIAQVEGVLRAVLKRAGNMGIIARATTESELEISDDKEFLYQVIVPRREDISAGDRAARILPDVEFVYYLAGAIHEAKVEGKITV